MQAAGAARIAQEIDAPQNYPGKLLKTLAEHISRWSGCILGWPECSETDPCAIHNRWKAVRTTYIQMLKRTTIAELVAKGELESIAL